MIGTVRRTGVTAAVLCFVGIHLVLAAVDAPALSVAGVVAYSGALALAVVAVTATLGRWPTAATPRRVLGWGVVAATVAATLLVLAVLPDSARGFALWFVSLGPVALSGVALRGLWAAALTGAVGNAGAVLGWSAATSAGPVSGLYRVVTPTAAVVVAIGIARLVERSRASVAAAYAARAEALRATAATRAARLERRRRLAEVERLAGPVLRRLARGDPLDERLAAECRLLEASLRDDIRVPTLATSTVREAVWSARARGVEVQLLDVSDQRGPARADDPAVAALRRCLARVLEELDSGRVTARLSSPGRATLVVVAPGAAELAALCEASETSPVAGANDAPVAREVERCAPDELLVTFEAPATASEAPVSGPGEGLLRA